jgi:hypothetical protein
MVCDNCDFLIISLVWLGGGAVTGYDKAGDCFADVMLHTFIS